MNVAAVPIPVSPPTTPTAVSTRRTAVIVDDKVVVPAWVDDLGTYRLWAHSDEYPQHGWIAYLDGFIWVDSSMEEFITHNQVKFAYDVAIGNCLLQNPIGRFAVDRMLLTNAQANLSTEPDGLFYRWSTMKDGRLQLVPGRKKGYMELEGIADMVLEIISESSVRKDKELLRDLYWKAGIAEYWLVDARTEPAQFDILRHTDQGYVATTPTDGWLRSEVLGREFRLVRQTDPLGHPQFVVEVR